MDCELCGDLIHPDRIEAIPSTTVCINCSDKVTDPIVGFMIYLEDIGVIQSTEWAFDNLSDGELHTLLNTHMVDYLAERDGWRL